MRVSLRFALAVGAVSVFLAMLLGQPPAAASQPPLSVTGSSFAGLAIQQWQGQFNESYDGQVNFTVSNSVVGLDDFCAQTVNFAASDLSYAAGQSDCSPAQVPYPYQYVPDVGGGLAFEYNLTDKTGKPITNLVLNATAIADIFTGAISYWNDPVIKQLNPGLRLPHEAITPYYRSDPSGENYLLSAYLVNADPTLITTFQQLASVPNPGQASATWATFPNGVPTSSQFPNVRDLVGTGDADASAQGPVHTPGGIAYDETVYAKLTGLPVASLVNEADNAVQPTASNVTAALQGASLNADLTENLTGVFDDAAPGAYPLSAYSYFVTQCDPTQAAAQGTSCDGTGSDTMATDDGAELGQFIDFVVCSGQDQMAALGYAPLPAPVVGQAFAAIGRIDGATEPPSPTAANCPNPAITGGTGSIAAIGSLASQASLGRTTLSVPSPTVGDAWVLAVRLTDASVSVSSVTGGGAGDSWTRLTQVSDPTENREVEEWLGPISSAGPSTITVTFSSSVSGVNVDLSAQQFASATGASTVWSEDVGGSSENDTATSSTVTYPTLAPASAGELYVGFSRSSSTSLTGNEPGFDYEFSSSKNLYIYDPNVSSSVSPVAAQQSGLSVTTGALIEAS